LIFYIFSRFSRFSRFLGESIRGVLSRAFSTAAFRCHLKQEQKSTSIFAVGLGCNRHQKIGWWHQKNDP